MLNYQVNINEQFKSTEILFDGKPSEAVREKLKANGYRWHKGKGVWYGYKTPEELAEILNGSDEQADDVKAEIKAKTDEQKAKEQADKEEQNRLKKLYIEILGREAWKGNLKMLEYFDKSISRVVELSDGSLIAIDKKSIETRFCFGYGQNGISDDEDEARADGMAHYARTQADYFISENLKNFSWEYEKLKAEPDNMYLGVKYYGSPEDSRIKSLQYFDWWRLENLNSETKSKLIKLSPDDVQKLIEAYEIERKNFEKRLNAYLKRYGTSKLNVWTYLSD